MCYIHVYVCVNKYKQSLPIGVGRTWYYIAK